MDFVLGLDGGGSKTAALLLSNTGVVLGPYTTSGINPFDNPLWQDTLMDLLNTLPEVHLKAACFGMPGYGEVEMVSLQQLETVQAWAGHTPISVINDVQVAFEGAFCDGFGVLMLAGTGSMAWGFDGQKHIRVGGWGEKLGDEGSAHWIGQQALNLLTHTLDGRLQDDPFKRHFSGHLDLSSTHPERDLLEWYYGLQHPRSQVAALAQQVDQLARAGNPTASNILSEASTHLALHLQAAWQKLNLPDQPLTWSHAGSLFKSQRVLEGVQQHLPEARWHPPVFRPLYGAVWHAAKKAGWDQPLERVQDAVSSVGHSG